MVWQLSVVYFCLWLLWNPLNVQMKTKVVATSSLKLLAIQGDQFKSCWDRARGDKFPGQLNGQSFFECRKLGRFSRKVS